MKPLTHSPRSKADHIGPLTFTLLRPPNGVEGIIVRTNDERIKNYFPGRAMSGPAALAGIVSGNCRFLDLELPNPTSTRRIEQILAERVIPMVLSDLGFKTE